MKSMKLYSYALPTVLLLGSIMVFNLTQRPHESPDDSLNGLIEQDEGSFHESIKEDDDEGKVLQNYHLGDMKENTTHLVVMYDFPEGDDTYDSVIQRTSLNWEQEEFSELLEIISGYEYNADNSYPVQISQVSSHDDSSRTLVVYAYHEKGATYDILFTETGMAKINGYKYNMGKNASEYLDKIKVFFEENPQIVENT